MRLYDETHQSGIEHRKAREYRRRKEKLKNAWITAGILFLLLPVGIGITGLVFLGFLSLSYLDERPYLEKNTD